MEQDLQISFRDLRRSARIEESIRAKVAKLEKRHGPFGRCEVMVEPSSKRQTKGDLFHVRIYLAVPGGEIVVGRDPAKAQDHEDVTVAVRDAFEAAGRQLQAYSERQRPDSKRRGSAS
ncbi:MAG: RNA polymerase subunit sigma-54 [Deltaproteobacteria bacterium]|nr:MAG: RNA polymerase subunit sigma-54 [Deltaproteobacteria bacterium]